MGFSAISRKFGDIWYYDNTCAPHKLPPGTDINIHFEVYYQLVNVITAYVSSLLCFCNYTP